MGSDPLLPIAPARVTTLLLPLGKIKAEEFTVFVQRLQCEHVVHLREITPDGRPNRNMFSPLGFPDGAMLFDLITHVPPASHLALTPFDLYREPLALVALADGKELSDAAFSKRHSASGATAASTVERNIRALSQELEDLRDNYPKTLVHQVIVFDYSPPGGSDIPMPEGIVAVPPLEQCKRTTMKTVMCDISSLLLAEMTTLAKTFEATTIIESPGIYLPGRHVNGHGAGAEGSISLPRQPSRSSSVSSGGEKTQSRMFTPPATVRSSSYAGNGRPTTPPQNAVSATPMSPEGRRSESSTRTSTPERKQQKTDSMDGLRDVNRDRISVHGFGVGSANDRWRLRGKGRTSVLIGSLYLQAGRWIDSLKELAEGATAARSLNDHIWHGKALELILVNLLLLGWSGLEFQIPTVCLSSQDRPMSLPGFLKAEENADPAQPKHLHHLQTLLPELLERILGLYSRISSESLPPLPLAETTIRFCKILTAIHLNGGQLNQRAFDIIMKGAPAVDTSTLSPRLSITPSRQQIANFLFRVFPSSTTDILTIADRISILSGIANVLGPLGYHRKKAMVIRELVSVLIAGLVEARTRGAAEAGVHPAAGLVSLVPGSDQTTAAGVALDLGEGDIEHGIEAFLELLCRSYGVVGFDVPAKSKSSDGESRDSDAETVARVLAQSSVRLFGFTEIKLNILRACINFSEALPDFNGVLKFSSDLMRTAGSGIAPGPKREDATPQIFREEQARLVTNICRTASLAERIGLGKLAAEYWDEFLVRGLALEPLPHARTPIPHEKSVLPGAVASRASQDVNPFIYNPFLKEPDQVPTQNLVAGELATFRVTLQNTYDVEIEIESIRLDAEGVEFEAVSETAILGPYRTQLIHLKGCPKTAGTVKVTGAVVQIRGCRQRRFPVFARHWIPRRAEKVKNTGIRSVGFSEHEIASSEKLSPKVLTLDVVQPQPLVIVKSTSLAQSSVMILEGERQVFSVTLKNTSTTTPVDFLLFSFKDSTQAPLQAALNSREATPAELYEYELILTKKPALKLPRNDQSRYIPPGGEMSYEFEILGKPGLTQATIQADYTYLGVPRDEVTEQFHTRQVLLELTVTVNASVELARIDAIPLHGPIPEPMRKRLGATAEAAAPDEYCLLAIDLRNAWPSQISVHLEGEDEMTADDSILPGRTNRVVIPVKRVRIQDPHAAVPSLNPSRSRQYVVSSSRISPAMERANREAFWYREKLLESLKATWWTTSIPKRSGNVELRNMRLTSRMIETVKVDEVGIDIWVDGAPDNVANVDEFLRVKVSIVNRTTKPISPLVRLLPALCHRPLNVALDYTRKFAWNGTLQQILPEIQVGGSTDFVLGVTVLCRGQFELAASVEEVQTIDDQPAEAKETGRARSDTQTLIDAALGFQERRIWHCRRPCILTVRDGDS